MGFIYVNMADIIIENENCQLVGQRRGAENGNRI